ncbi:hypothetical protein L207DRAFT_381075, partial [Hyaloscypha variabilis F]
PIRCSMSEIELDDNPVPVYRALSYSWELDPSLWWRTTPGPRRYTIICNGQSLAVGENLYLAIRYFASQADRAPIWIDAICIHQGTAEVSSQIQMMGRIYQSARDVVVWLGKPDMLSMLDMDEFLEAFSGNNKDKPSMKELLRTTASEVLVEYIFTLRWFMRVWVLQEAILAK